MGRFTAIHLNLLRVIDCDFEGLDATGFQLFDLLSRRNGHSPAEKRRGQPGAIHLFDAHSQPQLVDSNLFLHGETIWQ